ncbi:hypothetical protein [Falsibacillus pallidus]|uniref:hypothetical protein n=1 Tax=Falsibacillus pallidus TaxID=493781 RepID=UPI003D97ED9D
MKNKKFKNFIDDSISPNPIFTQKDQEKIIKQIRNLNDEKTPKTLFPRALSTVVVSMICLFLVGLGIYESGINNRFNSDNHTNNTGQVGSQKKKEFSLPSQSVINHKVEEIKSNFSIGMTKEKALKNFGNHYQTVYVQNPEGSELETWQFQLYNNSNAPKMELPPGDIDIDRLKNLNLGIDFTIIWDSSTAHMATLTYVNKETKVVTVLTFKANGATEIKEY